MKFQIQLKQIQHFVLQELEYDVKHLKTQSNVNLISPIIYGTVGYSAAIEFISFIKVYKTFTKYWWYFKWSCGIVPNEPSALYVLCSAIIEKYENINQAVNIFCL